MKFKLYEKKPWMCKPLWYHGVAHYKPELMYTLTVIMPFNMLIYWAIEFYYWCRCMHGQSQIDLLREMKLDKVREDLKKVQQ